MEIKVILTGATGLVGEGVLLSCMDHPAVKEILIINRKPSQIKHQKVKELIVADFFELDKFSHDLIGYNACFYCAGISSNGLNEEEYTKITYDTTVYFAQTLLKVNSDLTFCHISGSHTDSSEKSKVMWARVKGKTENELMRMPFKNVYNFRPGAMKPSAGQKNIKGYYKAITVLYPLLKLIFPNNTCLLSEVAQAMINSVLKGYPKHILEVTDIKKLAALS